MGDYENVMAEVHAAYGKYEISDACARVIASMYHTGQASESYAFASTGAIPEESGYITRQLFPELDGLSADEMLILGALGTYLINRPDRGPVEGWSRLWLSEHSNYPHDFGYLYDCPACEETCYCAPGHEECVACSG